VPFWRVVKLGEVPYLANFPRCCSVTAPGVVLETVSGTST